MEQTVSGDPYRIAVVGNATTNLIKEILEYSLRSHGIAAEVQIGNYDNIVQDSYNFRNANAIVVFWELFNLLDGFQGSAPLLPTNDLEGLIAKTEAEIDLVLRNLSIRPLVLFNLFTADIFTYAYPGDLLLDKVASRLNAFAEGRAGRTVRFVDLRRIFMGLGIRNCLDLRQFYSSKSVYKVDFFRAYADHVLPFFLAANGRSRKVLILDCDNTLWKGIIGEDGFDGIEMNPTTADGAVFAEVQRIALSLGKDGVLLGLCSKNNPGDIDEVFGSHPDMQLRAEDLVIKKVGWSNKVSSLKEISQQLNIGLESIVFVDDSQFEVEMVRQQLPEILTLQVPTTISAFPGLLRDHLPCFLTLENTTEDRQKTAMYKQQETRQHLRNEFSSLEDYLASLEQRLTIFVNVDSTSARLAQMCQKTNQFNLTTKRYLEADVRRFLGQSDKLIFAFSLMDRLGDSGITGLSILSLDEALCQADIDVFLMSCRVIGRNVEYAFMDHLLSALQSRQIKKVTARYIATPKNEMARTFFDSCGFSVLTETPSTKEYLLVLECYHPRQLSYIEVVRGG
ncbi:MAG: HAD-IIIC family phosphatase [Candidatus Omnitrophica bacterium]|nr:HAD-IIIC family phosphatase [Candidatus Omnitrophota bacterium]